MTALLLHIIWSTTYLITFIIFNLIILIFFKNRISSIKSYSSNYFIRLLLIFFFNKNLSFFKNLLDIDEIESIEISRLKSWPVLNFIHSNINKISNKGNIPVLNFKQDYKTFLFIKNNFNIENMFILKEDKKIHFYILYIIIKNNFKNINIINFNDFLVSLIISKNSISSSSFKVSTYNLLKFGDYISYINNITLLDSFNRNKLIINNLSDTSTYSTKSSFDNYIKYLNLNILNNMLDYKNNYFYLTVYNKYLNLNIEFNAVFLDSLKNIYNISFSASNIVKYISDYSVNNSVILYLRRNKIFNKSRYSRNRQTYRTGAYWCLYVNIIAVVAFYFWFYKFTMNFGYLWWLLYIFILSFFLSRALKHRFYNPLNILIEFIAGFKWLILILLILIEPIILILSGIKNWLYLTILIKLYQINNFSKIFKEVKLNLLYLQQSFNWIFYLNKIINNYINKFI